MSRERETLRQQALLHTLWGDAPFDTLQPWLAPHDHTGRGWQAYRANAGALAERALSAAYPTLRQLISDESFAALAREFWRRQPPQAGDIALWGAGLPAFVAAAASLADTPYLADIACLEWAVHEAERAADPQPATGLELLATHNPHTLQLQLSAGTALVVSSHPIVTLWQAHRSPEADRFIEAQRMLNEADAEMARITRRGLAAQVHRIDAGTVSFTAALLTGATLGAALDAAGTDFDFETWLIAALRSDQIATVTLPSA